MDARSIKVTAGTTVDYFDKIIPSTTKISDFLTANQMSSQGASIQLDGKSLTAAEQDKTFGDLVSGNDCRLFSVVNAKNA
jgi:hypothetical protein